MKPYAVSLIAIACLAVLTVSAQGQKKRDNRNAGKHPPVVVGPILPIEVKIGLHRLSEKAVFLTIKNQHPKLAISKVICSVDVFDILKATMVKSYYSLNFNFPLTVEPGKTGEAVVTKSDDATVGQDWTPAQCRTYEAGEKDIFAPSECKGDALLVFVMRVKYKDGSEWVSRSIHSPATHD
jgi:hypothetical protein